MPDCVVDTNVLLVASAAEPFSPFADTHVPPGQQRIVFEWLAAFRRDTTRRLALDDAWRIYEEYRNRLTDQDFGLLAIHDKLQTARIVTLEWDAAGYAVVPAALQTSDPSDRKFLGVALSDPATIVIVNAADSDWLEVERELDAAGVRVVHLLESWLREGMASR